MLYVDQTNNIITQNYFYLILDNTVYLYDNTLARFFKSVTYKSIEDFNKVKHNFKRVGQRPHEVQKAINELLKTIKK